jgi:hypothetical protein
MKIPRDPRQDRLLKNDRIVCRIILNFDRTGQHSLSAERQKDRDERGAE